MNSAIFAFFPMDRLADPRCPHRATEYLFLEAENEYSMVRLMTVVKKITGKL